MKKILFLMAFFMFVSIPVFSQESQVINSSSQDVQSDDNTINYESFDDLDDEEQEYERELQEYKNSQPQSDNQFNPNESNYNYQGAGGAS